MADERFVVELAATLGLTCDVMTAPPGPGGEASLRAARHRLLRESARRSGATKIALGHTLDDQAETVLMRLMRGSGVEGAAAIFPVVDGLFVRPLLEISRREVVVYLESLGVSWREDSTNGDLRLARNRIRRELIPYLQSHFNPSVVAALARSAEAARETGAFLDSEAARALAEIGRPTPRGVTLDAAKLAGLHPALAKLVLRAAVRSARGDNRRLTARHLAFTSPLPCAAWESPVHSRPPFTHTGM